MEPESFLSQDDLVNEMDAEVKRIADLFRFLLKYKEQFKPSGIEFSDLRKYLVTDDASRIDWKHSANTPDLYVKEYEEEKDMDTFVIVDASNTMLFGTAEKLKAEYAAVMAGAIAFASIDAGMNVGLGMYGDTSTQVTPEGGMVQYRSILHELTDKSNYGGTFDLKKALENTIETVKPNTTLFIVSDFIDMKGEAWKPTLRVCSEKFRHVMAVMTRDTRDYEMPEAGKVRFEGPGGSEQIVANTGKIKEEFEAEAERQEQEIKSDIQSGGAAFLKVDTREQFAANFAQYFDEAGGNW